MKRRQYVITATKPYTMNEKILYDTKKHLIENNMPQTIQNVYKPITSKQNIITNIDNSNIRHAHHTTDTNIKQLNNKNVSSNKKILNIQKNLISEQIKENVPATVKQAVIKKKNIIANNQNINKNLSTVTVNQSINRTINIPESKSIIKKYKNSLISCIEIIKNPEERKTEFRIDIDRELMVYDKYIIYVKSYNEKLLATILKNNCDNKICRILNNSDINTNIDKKITLHIIGIDIDNKRKYIQNLPIEY